MSNVTFLLGYIIALCVAWSLGYCVLPYFQDRKKGTDG